MPPSRPTLMIEPGTCARAEELGSVQIALNRIRERVNKTLFIFGIAVCLPTPILQETSRLATRKPTHLKIPTYFFLIHLSGERPHAPVCRRNLTAIVLHVHDVI